MISIIIPAYNSEPFLEKTVASVCAQTLSDWELIIVDDGATDATGRLADHLAAADERIRVIHQVNGGSSRARNAGIAVMNPSAMYVTFIDADDLWMPDALEMLMAVLADHPEWAGVHGLGRYIDETGQPIRPGELEQWGRARCQVSDDLSRRIARPTTEPTTFETEALRNCILVGTALFRRVDFERAGRFKEGLRSAEDWHMWLRVTLIKPIGYVDRVVMSYRRHGNNMSRSIWKMRRIRFIAAQDIYEKCTMTQHQRRMFLHSQSSAIQLFWAWDHAAHGRFAAAARHVGIAVRGIVDYHVLPKIGRQASVSAKP